MTSPESGGREPRGHYCIACNAAPCSEAVERFAEALVRAVEDATAPYWKDDMDMEPRLTRHPGLRQDEILGLISALRSPADTGEHVEGDVGS